MVEESATRSRFRIAADLHRPWVSGPATESTYCGSLRRSMYSPSLDLKPKDGADLPQCEIDFVWLIPRPYPGKTAVILGECKDRGGKGDKDTIDAKDIDNLKRVADAL